MLYIQKPVAASHNISRTAFVIVGMALFLPVWCMMVYIRPNIGSRMIRMLVIANRMILPGGMSVRSQGKSGKLCIMNVGIAMTASPPANKSAMHVMSTKKRKGALQIMIIAKIILNSTAITWMIVDRNFSVEVFSGLLESCELFLFASSVTVLPIFSRLSSSPRIASLSAVVRANGMMAQQIR